MCGILAVFAKTGSSVRIPKKLGKRLKTLRELAYRQSGIQRHRGPDHTGVVHIPEDDVCIVQERLALMGLQTGDQPLVSADGNIIMAANGEIYNYLEISAEIAKRYGKYTPRSDCDVILPLYEMYGEQLLQRISGMFSFVLYDRHSKHIIIARDPIGIIPLYRGYDTSGNLWIASEMKSLVDVCDRIQIFPPGTVCHGQIDSMIDTEYYQPKWCVEIPSTSVDLTLLRQKLEAAVRSHLQCDKEIQFGALLSGGVDSSLIASIATNVMREKFPNFRLKTYSVGLENAPDFKYSRMVADYINSDHREIIFKVEDGLDCIRDIIWHTETYDVTTVRCSIPMYLLSQKIKSDGLKMILSGEGADELFGGYLYFFHAPNTEEFHYETVKRVKALHFSDCLRANKATMSWGLELRVPFLDRDFVNYAMSIRPADRIPGTKNQFGSENGMVQRPSRIEKHILRAAFTDNYLPHEVIWRQKEQFSDGVGYSWIDGIRDFASSHINDYEFSRAQEIFPFNTPSTKEAFYYRAVFEEMFPNKSYAETVMRWIPRKDWGCPEDPSGRAQLTHTAAYKK